MPTAENGLLPADIQIKPHHFLLPDVKDAFRGRRDLEELADERIACSAQSSTDANPAAYIRDILGSTKQDRAKFRNGVLEFYTKLRELPDSSTVLLGQGLDGICKSACVGRHCTLFDMRYVEQNRDATALEFVELSLRQNRYRRGRDWQKTTTTSLVFDSRGSHLSTPSVPVPVVREFPAIVAKAGVLRGR